MIVGANLIEAGGRAHVRPRRRRSARRQRHPETSFQSPTGITSPAPSVPLSAVRRAQPTAAGGLTIAGRARGEEQDAHRPRGGDLLCLPGGFGSAVTESAAPSRKRPSGRECPEGERPAVSLWPRAPRLARAVRNFESVMRADPDADRRRGGCDREDSSGPGAWSRRAPLTMSQGGGLPLQPTSGRVLPARSGGPGQAVQEDTVSAPIVR